MPISSVPPGTLFFGSLFFNELIRAYIVVTIKSQLVAQNYAYEDYASVETNSPTVHSFNHAWSSTPPLHFLRITIS